MKEITQHYDFERDMLGFTAFNPDNNEIVVSFRGTNGATDWKNWGVSLQMKLMDYKNVTGAQVH
jgi:hypothetical protein